MSTIKLWKEISRQTAFQKYSRRIERIIFLLPTGKEADFYVKAEGPASCIFGLTIDNQVILVKQFRPGPMEILNELPGGFVDINEEPIDTARREFLEETGYEGELAFIGTCLDDAYSTMERSCFVARNCIKVGEPLNTDTEETEVVLMALPEFRIFLRKGRMSDIEVAYLALDHLKLL